MGVEPESDKLQLFFSDMFFGVGAVARKILVKCDKNSVIKSFQPAF